MKDVTYSSDFLSHVLHRTSKHHASSKISIPS